MLCCFRVVQVVRHDARSAEQDLASLTGRHLGPSIIHHLQVKAWTRATDGSGDRLQAIIWACSRHRSGLGQSVATYYPRKGELIMNATDQVDGDIRRPSHSQAQARQVEEMTFRVIEDSLVERRGPGEHRDGLVSDPGQHMSDIEHWLGKHCGPARDTSENSRLEPEHMKVRV